MIRPPLPPDGSAPTLLRCAAMTVPVAMGYIPLGIVFGFLFVQAGGAGWLAVLTSLIVYAGAAQYMMIPMLVAGVSPGAIALATLVVNLRHAFYGLSLLDKLPPGRWQRGYLAFALTDETYSLVTTLPDGNPPQQMVWIAALNQGWWVLGSGIGAALGAQAQITLAGLDFVLVALFCVLTVEQWRARKSAAPLWVALAAYGVACLLSARHALVIAIAITVAIAWVMQRREADLETQK